MKTLLAAALLLLAAACYAGQTAITDTGDKVILNSDGTWVYANKASKPVVKIGTNTAKFNKPADATFLLKSTKNNAAFWTNTDKWSFSKTAGETAEYQFQLKGKSLFGMAITEEVEIPLEALAEIAFENARKVAPDLKIVMQEYRIVNGNKVIYMEMNGTLKGIDFTYLGYYYSNASGTTQFVAYTGTKTIPAYRSEMNDFLNGLVTQ
jgi:hypothetical protein